jgi:mono/diheme cytochrome c family protein
MSYVTGGCGAAAVLMMALTLSLGAQPAPQGRGAAPAQGGRGRGAAPPQTGLSAGPADLPVVDEAAAARGRTVYAAQCINCHGTQARGTANGANLVRSIVVLHDRYGSELGPFLKKGHPMQGGAAVTLTDAQITDLANFLRQRVNDSLRGSPIFHPGDVLVGDAKAGEAYFNGAGRCSTCHGAENSLAGIANRYSPVDLQQRLLFPRTGRGRGGAARAVTVTVKPASGESVSGVLVEMDDFNVLLRDPSGAYHSFKRGPGLTVEKTDPLAAHVALLDTITDKQLHDVVAYLETLK